MATIMLLAACGTSTGSNSGSGINTQTVSGTINFGLPSGYTGRLVVLGSAWLNGAKAAADVINSNGGVYGQKVNLVPVDTAFDALDAVPVIRKMLAVDDVKVSVGLAALDYTDALPILNQAKMVNFTIIGSPAIDHTLMPYSYAVRVSDALEGAAMVVQAKKKGYTKIAEVFDASGGAQTFPPAVQLAADKLGLKIVSKPSVPESSASYESEIQEVISSHPDVVLMQIEPTQAGAFFDEWKTLGATNIPIISSDQMMATTYTPALGQDEIQNHITGVQSLTDVTGKAGQFFKDTYSRIFNAAFGYFAVYSWDGVTLAALAMTAAHSTDPKVYQPFVDDVTKVASDHVTCYTYPSCVQLLKQGKKIKYSGVGSTLIYNKYHRVSGDFGSYTLPLTTNDTPKQLSTIPGSELVGLY